MSITKKRKERVSISINPEILDLLDRSVSSLQATSRSDAIEKVIYNFVSERKKCVILAGGPHENLKIGDTYRPLVKIKGKYLIENIIEKAKRAGYNDILIIGSKEVLSEIFKALGETDITYLEEKKSLHSAKTLQFAREHIRSTFLFVPCDHYFEIDLKDMERYHKQHQGLCTLAVYSGTEHEWKKTSIVKVEGDHIIDYEEHPKYVKTHLTGMLIGFAEPSVFDSIPSDDISYSLQKDVFPELAKKNKLFGYIYSGLWKNIHEKKDVDELVKSIK